MPVIFINNGSLCIHNFSASPRLQLFAKVIWYTFSVSLLFFSNYTARTRTYTHRETTQYQELRQMMNLLLLELIILNKILSFFCGHLTNLRADLKARRTQQRRGRNETRETQRCIRRWRTSVKNYGGQLSAPPLSSWKYLPRLWRINHGFRRSARERFCSEPIGSEPWLLET